MNARLLAIITIVVVTIVTVSVFTLWPEKQQERVVFKGQVDTINSDLNPNSNSNSNDVLKMAKKTLQQVQLELARAKKEEAQITGLPAETLQHLDELDKMKENLQALDLKLTSFAKELKQIKERESAYVLNKKIKDINIEEEITLAEMKQQLIRDLSEWTKLITD
ncbi:MAG: hypothetical protein HQK52_09210 [Oligoflexia bacterium]|nr:hypothetical protein [Oligoflexia bacterium]